jgi:hypothetical protein
MVFSSLRARSISNRRVNHSTDAIYRARSDDDLYRGKSWYRFLFSSGWGFFTLTIFLYFSKNPAFGAAHIRELTEIFVDKSRELRDVWAREIEKREDENGRINVLSWLSRMTLDVIGLAGTCDFETDL